jgi:hypothetical protein
LSWAEDLRPPLAQMATHHVAGDELPVLCSLLAAGIAGLNWLDRGKFFLPKNSFFL